MFLCLGGPSLKASLSKNFSISYSLMPSVRVNLEEEDKNRVAQSILGTGLQFQYKRFILATPLYFLPAPKGYWSMALGIGFKL